MESLSADCTGTVALGDVKTCTITNDDIAPLLTLVKMVTKDDGGTAEPDQWDYLEILALPTCCESLRRAIVRLLDSKKFWENDDFFFKARAEGY